MKKIKFFSFFSFLFFVNSLLSQNEIDSTKFYFEQKNYDKALSYLLKHEDYVTLINHGVNFFKMNDFKNACNFLNKGYEFEKERLNDINKINLQIFLSISFYEVNDFKNSILYRESAVKLQEIKYGTNDINYLNSLNKLADLYTKDGQFEKAEITLLKTINIREILFGENNLDYAISVSSLATLYDNLGKYSLSEPLYLKLSDIYKNLLGEKSSEYLIVLNNLAYCYLAQYKYLFAEPLFLKVYDLKKNIYGENHFSLVVTLNNLGFLFQKQHRYIDAENSFLRALNICKDNIGDKNIEYLNLLDNLARLYFDQAKYSEAEFYFLKNLSFRENKFGEKDRYYYKTLEKLASLYQYQGDFSKAELLFLKSIEFYKENYGERSLEYAVSIGNLGFLYNLEFKFIESEKLLLKSKEIIMENSSKYNIEYVVSNLNLSYLYIRQEKYFFAESLLKEAIEILKKDFKNNDTDYARTLKMLGDLYISKGNFPKAENLFLESINITEMTLGRSHPDIVNSLNGLASIYEKKGDFSKAEKYMNKIIEIVKSTFGTHNFNYSSALNNLAGLYQHQRRFSEAEKLYLEALNICLIINGENNIDYAITLSNLASTFLYQKKYKNAEELFLKVSNIFTNYLGLNNSYNINTLHYLAILFRLEGFDEKASNYFEQFILLNQEKTLDDIFLLTESELIAYKNLKRINLFSPLSFLKDNSIQYENVVNSCFNSELLNKNLTLRNIEQIKKSIQKGNNILLKDKYEQFISNKRKLTKLSELSNNEITSITLKLKEEIEQLEKELIKESITFSNFKNSISINFKQIRDNLKKNEIYIDIVSFNYYKENVTDSIIYSAFVVGKNFKFPKFIPLFEEKQLALLLGKDKNQHDSIRIDKQYLNKHLSELILKPMENELKGISTIYLSLSGLTHQINVPALPINENQTFGQKYKIHILNSPSELMDYKSITFDKKDKLDFILYGNIDYDKRNIIPNKDSLDNQDFVNVDEEIKDLQTRSGISNFGYLSGTKNEIENISTLANKSNLKTIIFEDRNATEESIKQLDGRTTPFVLHLATHGFFFPDPVIEMSNEFLIEGKSKVFKTSDDPMMRSGLVFSGANKSWGKVNENLSGDDGILSASEISNLDLSACELVVLSACETGLGEVKGSEGVFGLQRAFKMAGVKNIIMSLWKVPDAQTAELFDTFYSECFAGKTIHEAFHSAQAKMKAKYSPYYWAGFVLLE